MLSDKLLESLESLCKLGKERKKPEHSTKITTAKRGLRFLFCIQGMYRSK